MANLILKFLGLFGIQYRNNEVIDEVTRVNQVTRGIFKITEGERSAIVCTDPGRDDPKYIIAGYTPKSWEPPHDKEAFTEEDRERIQQKLVIYFDRCNATYEFSYRP